MPAARSIPMSLILGVSLLGILIAAGATCGVVILAQNMKPNDPPKKKGDAAAGAEEPPKEAAPEAKPERPKPEAFRMFTADVHKELSTAWNSNPQVAAKKYEHTRFRAVGRVREVGYSDWVDIVPIKPDSAFTAGRFGFPNEKDRLKLSSGKWYLIEFTVKMYPHRNYLEPDYVNATVIEEVEKKQPEGNAPVKK